ncbi:MAG: hypothetical protein GX101_09020 [Firmicutes bacterium]|nr:hypothetical protein [Bacillota bacterium]
MGQQLVIELTLHGKSDGPFYLRRQWGGGLGDRLTILIEARSVILG